MAGPGGRAGSAADRSGAIPLRGRWVAFFLIVLASIAASGISGLNGEPLAQLDYSLRAAFPAPLNRAPFAVLSVTAVLVFTFIYAGVFTGMVRLFGPRFGLIALLVGGTLQLLGVTFWLSNVETRQLPPPLDVLNVLADAVPAAAQMSVISTTLAIVVILLLSVSIALSRLGAETRAHDLIYYLGFIGTISGLLGASYELIAKAPGTSEVTAVPVLMAKNGIALGSTIAGLFCRNLLRYMFPAERSPLESVRKALEDVRVQADTARRALASLGGDLTSTMDAARRSATSETEKAVADLTTATNVFGERIQLLSQQIGTMSQVAAATAEPMNRQVQSWIEINQATQSLGSSLAQVVANLDAVAQRLDAASQRLEGLRWQHDQQFPQVPPYGDRPHLVPYPQPPMNPQFAQRVVEPRFAGSHAAPAPPPLVAGRGRS